ncbi:MAG: inovirus Gp2 family protein [Arenimonas sp.]|uniref:YagK/YfjJ domain-containing protein n=1 Tax=Arenimonas sp. TaxID=1872635 RepID=UPI0025C3A2B0|nr:inovirus-type Gp2 protein [Arenimonas sp.]MBW8366809.1 inovirus Gp2 family protein [Arenimonas sp.]
MRTKNSINLKAVLQKAMVVGPDCTTRLITDGATYLRDLKLVSEFMGQLSKGGSAPFFSCESGELLATPLGATYLDLLGIDSDGIRRSFPGHAFSPAFVAFSQHLDASRFAWDGFRPPNEMLETEIRGLQLLAKSDGYKGAVALHNRGSRKNFASLMELIDSLFETSSKVLAVRVDLGFVRSQLFGGSLNYIPDANQARAYLRTMLKYLRQKHGKMGLLAYAWKLELGPDKGYHVHLLALYDGQKACRDIQLGQAIGEHWQHLVTRGLGLYYNCNANKQEYWKLGIGMISHSDTELRDGLRLAAAYLTKLDELVKLALPSPAKTFGKSKLPSAKHSGLGRPRLKKQEE